MVGLFCASSTAKGQATHLPQCQILLVLFDSVVSAASEPRLPLDRAVTSPEDAVDGACGTGWASLCS